MGYARIAGTGSYLPPKILTNHDIAAMGVDTTHDWVVARTGIESRRVAVGETTSDLALHAARKAMDAAGVTAADIDLIVLATTSPDMLLPSTAALLQAKLGVRPGAAAFDVQAVCTGFMYAITVAEALVSRGQFKCALVIGAETLTRYLDWKDRNSCVLFGAGAAILKPADKPGILSSHLHADGNLSGILRLTGGFAGGEVTGNPYVELDGQAVFKVAVRVLEEVAREALEHNGYTAEQLDWLVPHQANLRIISAAAERLGLPMERVVTTVQRHGNTSAASAILALDEAVRDGRIRSGQLVMLQGVGGGMTWGSVLVRWG
ncbi:MAG TPA: beta-ketoacyl-ACP synthase III [Verrucomicrobiae bacterium]|nr:beta-ketoacyl-ACP synthase III [Verrucomicrobiae bacterium]